MLRYRRFLLVLAFAFLAQADFGRAQSFSARKASFSPSPGGNVVQAVACGPTSITESSSTTITPLNSVSCNNGGLHTDNHYWRAFVLTDFSLTTDFQVCEVTIGVEEASSIDGTQPITVNLYTSDPAFPGGTLTPIGTAGFAVPDQTGTLLTIPVAGSVPSGSQLVVEIFTPSGEAAGNSFFIGSNAAAETGPSYVSAAACGIPTPTTTADLGFPDMHIVMSVNGTATGPVGMTVDPLLGVAISGNGVLEIGETTVIAPAWANGGATDFSLTGVASNLTGPFGPIYSIDDTTADYGVITAGSSKDCLTGTPDCYAITITGNRPVQHFDVTLDEAVTPSPLTLKNDVILKTWTLHVGESFSDVTPDGPDAAYYPSIENIYHHGVTAGCLGGAQYCPQAPNLRSEMAVFLDKGAFGSDYTPPDCAGIFVDVPCPATVDFPFSNWIEDIYTQGITAGCAGSPGPPNTLQYCPDQAIPRSQMAVFLDKASHDPGYAPPDCVGLFIDVPCPVTPEFPYSNFIEDIYNQGITAGCAGDPGPPNTLQFCPDQPVTRETMAVFIAKTFKLALYGP